MAQGCYILFFRPMTIGIPAAMVCRILMFMQSLGLKRELIMSSKGHDYDSLELQVVIFHSQTLKFRKTLQLAT